MDPIQALRDVCTAYPAAFPKQRPEPPGGRPTYHDARLHERIQKRHAM
jgi:hypothetical protein